MAVSSSGPALTTIHQDLKQARQPRQPSCRSAASSGDCGKGSGGGVCGGGCSYGIYQAGSSFGSRSSEGVVVSCRCAHAMVSGMREGTLRMAHWCPVVRQVRQASPLLPGAQERTRVEGRV
jgi:hypothetical protein